MRLKAGSRSVEAKGLAESKAVTIALADRSLNKSLSTADVLEVRGEGATLRVPLDGSTAALARLDACLNGQSSSGRGLTHSCRLQFAQGITYDAPAIGVGGEFPSSDERRTAVPFGSACTFSIYCLKSPVIDLRSMPYGDFSSNDAQNPVPYLGNSSLIQRRSRFR